MKSTYQKKSITPSRIGENSQIVNKFRLSGRLARVIGFNIIILRGWDVGDIIFGDIGRVGFDRCFLHLCQACMFHPSEWPRGAREVEGREEAV
jgi:hypothetical protein